ncbi:hypothetical protein HYH03_017442 [Edaphochlamys debaryana]|uniref:Uncharacterized protein n=1 Tax=Edaphochlamys debaryana TaxID=47281 RepID=A0A835XPB3_9CHLO|nr:hypothetical protein HYH03_017442 [Edaphochlamys debaryana]|eukprot:KAG2483724.1 hypothetical protein HYH03_017442 [Edaphochlamys debaryana]
MPSLPPPFQKQVVGADVMAHVAAAFQGVATLVPPPPGPPAPPPPPPAPTPTPAGAAGAKGPPRASCAPCPAPTPVVALEVAGRWTAACSVSARE